MGRKDTEIQNICSLCSLCAHIDNLIVVNETFVFLVLIEYAFHFIHIGAAWFASCRQVFAIYYFEGTVLAIINVSLDLGLFTPCSSNANPPFWIPIHIVIPERPTECAVFNVIAGTLLLFIRAIVSFG